MTLDLSHPAAAFGLGVALGTAPGPVQLLLLSEASRGGVGRGIRAMAGANGTFGAMMLLLAAGLSSLDPGEAFLRVVKVIGGAFLVFLAVDAVREQRRERHVEAPGSSSHPSVRGVVAVLLNPGVYVFLATTGTAVSADAADAGGRALAIVTAVALVIGVSTIDLGMVLLGSGARRVGEGVLRAVGIVLALGLAALGVWLIVGGVAG